MRFSIIFVIAIGVFGIAKAEKTPQSILDALRKDLHSMQADFIQYQEIENGGREDENSGQVWLQSPDKFRWLYQQPLEQLIVADGQQVWVYDEDLEQVTVKKQDNELNPIYVIINDQLSNEHYDIKLETSVQGVDWISLTPKKPSQEVKTVWLAIKDDKLHRIKVINTMQQTLMFEFSQVVKNPQLAKDLFTFTPPEGVDVIHTYDNQQGGEF